ncbi:hypothetical protein [Amycolatopsis sp. H20-H5]|uniref:hypothetical protein n=1 Tax=Amycolatopsis sp. H20-H5 TaxID=3046309 RepID=UPI002DBE92AA|nr:hypothetical protein [Amycolatopsis sp. H20-H5]MEC3978998.1 hypothetical protein [Amycolatopsis sp. H20-H5]
MTEENSAVRGHLTWITAAKEPVDHAVSETGLACGIAAGGVFLALCGLWFGAASMAAEPGGVCEACHAVVAPPVPEPRRRPAAHRPLWRRVVTVKGPWRGIGA